MKKYVFPLALFAMQQLSVAQTVNVHFKNGQVIEYPSVNVDYVDFSAKPADPTVTAGQVVDLGLSIYWASCNLGAEKPEESGEYYAWGETKPKNTYTDKNYSYYDNNLKQYINIGEDIGGTQYDAATVNLGGDWRMPMAVEKQELIDKCTWEKIQVNNILGYLVTGTNGNTIFLPWAGCGGLYQKGYGYGKFISLATATRGKVLDTEVGGLYLKSREYYRGFSIRPVTSNINAGGAPINHSQDHLVTDKISASFIGGSTYSINGVIQSGSVLNFKISNGSTESIELTGIQLINGSTGSEGNNALSENVTIATGESNTYSITVGSGGISKPKVRFTYKYNQKKYYVEASVPDV